MFLCITPRLLLPFCSLLYFSTYSFGPAILQAHMDGKNMTTLYRGRRYDKLAGLTLDKANKRLYWVERIHGKLRYLDLVTMQETVVRDDLESPVGLALYRGYLYWTSRGSGGFTGGVYRSAPTMNSTVTKVVSLLRHPTGIYAQDSQKNEGGWKCLLDLSSGKLQANINRPVSLFRQPVVL